MIDITKPLTKKYATRSIMDKNLGCGLAVLILIECLKSSVILQG
jgi:hypothetical protein